MTDVEMKIDPQRAAALVSQIKTVRERIAAVANGRDVSRHRPPILHQPPFFLFTTPGTALEIHIKCIQMLGMQLANQLIFVGPLSRRLKTEAGQRHPGARAAGFTAAGALWGELCSGAGPEG